MLPDSMSAVEAPHWNKQKTRKKMDMYNARTRLVDSVSFPEPGLAIARLRLRGSLFSPAADAHRLNVIYKRGEGVILGEVEVTEANVAGHLTPKYGISVVSGVDQLAAAVNVQRENIYGVNREEWEAALKTIKGSVEFVQPVGIKDKMLITPSNLGKNYLSGDLNITVFGSTVMTASGIEFDVVGKIEAERRANSEIAKLVLVEAGAQTAVAHFRHHADPEGYIRYGGITGPMEWSEEISLEEEVEIHFREDVHTPLKGDVTIFQEGRMVASFVGNTGVAGDREKDPQRIKYLIQRRARSPKE